jgi:hypothetical protein
MRFVGERRALAAAAMAFFTLNFIGGALSPGIPAPLKPIFLALGAAYLAAFVGLVAGWFWARWYTLGLSFSGLVLAALMAREVGITEPLVLIFGGSHLATGLALLGPASAAFYDGRRDWREKWSLDDNGVNRLGKAVMRAGASLPYLIIAGLAPKPGAAMVVGVAAVALGALGLRALIRMRTWGLFALGGAAALVVDVAPDVADAGWFAPPPDLVAPVLAIILLIAAVAPFARPVARALAAPRDN